MQVADDSSLKYTRRELVTRARAAQVLYILVSCTHFERASHLSIFSHRNYLTTGMLKLVFTGNQKFRNCSGTWMLQESVTPLLCTASTVACSEIGCWLFVKHYLR